ncbi:spermatogenesis-associated protein 7 homolog [Amia ocellicauda]|uniref:spermatogenesis-associated protein 7 homolog n=1 Tax=Amia ocellicauda TaxID=2972642 RepID=UPI003463A37B
MNQGKTSFLSGYRYYAPPQQRHTTLRGRFGKEAKLFRSHTSTDLYEELPAREEELRYLQFLEDVTTDILLNGFYSNKKLESVFQRHMTSRCDLSEVKMRTILEDVRRHLNGGSRELDFSICYTGELHAGILLSPHSPAL